MPPRSRIEVGPSWPPEYALVARMLVDVPDLRRGLCVGQAPHWDIDAPDSAYATRACRACPVKDPCEQWALSQKWRVARPEGIVAGKKRDRGKIKTYQPHEEDL